MRIDLLAPISIVNKWWIFVQWLLRLSDGVPEKIEGSVQHPTYTQFLDPADWTPARFQRIELMDKILHTWSIAMHKKIWKHPTIFSHDDMLLFSRAAGDAIQNRMRLKLWVLLGRINCILECVKICVTEYSNVIACSTSIMPTQQITCYFKIINDDNVQELHRLDFCTRFHERFEYLSWRTSNAIYFWHSFEQALYAVEPTAHWRFALQIFEYGAFLIVWGLELIEFSRSKINLVPRKIKHVTKKRPCGTFWLTVILEGNQVYLHQNCGFHKAFHSLRHRKLCNHANRLVLDGRSCIALYLVYYEHSVTRTERKGAGASCQEI